MLCKSCSPHSRAESRENEPCGRQQAWRDEERAAFITCKGIIRKFHLSSFHFYWFHCTDSLPWSNLPPFPITWPAHLFPLSFHQPCSKDTGPFPHIPCKVVFSAPALVFQPFFFVCLPSFWISLPVLMSTMWTFIFLLVFETYSGSKPGYLLSLYSPGVSLKENGVRFLLLFCLVLRSFLVVCLLWIH